MEGRITLKFTCKKYDLGGGGLNSIDMFQDTEQETVRCREDVILRVPKFGDYLSS